MANVWLVDDEPGVLSTLAMAVERALDVEVCTYNYATEFLHDCNHADGVLVLDYNLPDLQGNEVVRILSQTNRPIPTLLMSGDLTLEDTWHQISSEPGGELVRQIFSKPFRAQDLMSVIGDLLGQKRPECPR